MTDTQADATQADADGQSQADLSSDESQADQSISLAEAKKLRAEANSLRQRLRLAEQKASSLENAGKSEDEQRAAKLQAAEERASALEQQLRAVNARQVVQTAAGKANALDPAAIARMALDDLDFDDDGEPTNVREVLAQLRQDHPRLFQAAPGDAEGGRRGDAGANQDMNALIRRAMGRT